MSCAVGDEGRDSTKPCRLNLFSNILILFGYSLAKEGASMPAISFTDEFLNSCKMC